MFQNGKKLTFLKYICKWNAEKSPLPYKVMSIEFGTTVTARVNQEGCCNLDGEVKEVETQEHQNDVKSSVFVY